ncbi:hypothetical protein ACFVXC_37785 [Streptomyces sp. NPDC058257]|uniref:hypothetical protein n=1 Tax=Streptomyces sp. NPDC058257 TaxID=3346409 RepID=UPI0036ED18E2
MRLLPAPGHVRLSDKPPITDAAGRLADFLPLDIEPALTCPHALFGPSVGLRVPGGGHFSFQGGPGPLLRHIERDAGTAFDAAGATRSF